MDSSTDNMMPLEPMEPIREPRDWPSMINSIIIAATVVVVALTAVEIVVGAFLLLFGHLFNNRWMMPLAAIMPQLGRLLTGIAICVLCGTGVFLIYLLRSVLHQSRSMDQRLAALAEQTFNQANASSVKHETPPELVEACRVLADIREIMLLPDVQRQARFRSMMQSELGQRLSLAKQFIEIREFHRARQELASLGERFGQSDDIHKVEEILQAAVNSAMAEDVEAATRKAADLMNMAHWEQAEQYARELTQKYPDANEPRKLLARVQEERVLFARRHRQRMHDEIQQFVNERRWREAAAAAENFIHTFPSGIDTDALRQQLDTLKANAEIEIRQHLERHIKEHLARKDYWAALELARRIISEYPFSPQANALRMQLPKLEELVRQQGPRS